MKKVIIVGAGGLAKEIYCIIKDINKHNISWEFIGFIDTLCMGKVIIDEYSVIGDDTYAVSNLTEISIIVGIGTPSLREKIYHFYKKNGDFDFPNILHPNVVGDFENIVLDEGNIIAGGAILSTGIRIGRCNIINMSTIVAHDVKISNFCTINPGANISGNVEVEDRCLIGANSIIHQGLTIKQGTTLGLGSALTRSTVPHSTYFGNPAKRTS